MKQRNKDKANESRKSEKYVGKKERKRGSKTKHRILV